MSPDAHPSPTPDGVARLAPADRGERDGPGSVDDNDADRGPHVDAGAGPHVDPGAHVDAGAGAHAGAGTQAGASAHAGAGTHAGASADAGALAGAGAGAGADAGVAADAGVPSPSADPAADEARLAAYAAALADGMEAALPGWVAGCVERVLVAWSGTADAAVMDQARAAGDEAAAVIGPELRALLARDIDEQRTNPLAVVRRAVVYPTAVLRAAGVPAVVRDADAEARFPDDAYDLMPAAFADLDPALHEPGLVWGAAKAHVHLARRRAEGRR